MMLGEVPDLARGLLREANRKIGRTDRAWKRRKITYAQYRARILAAARLGVDASNALHSYIGELDGDDEYAAQPVE